MNRLALRPWGSKGAQGRDLLANRVILGAFHICHGFGFALVGRPREKGPRVVCPRGREAWLGMRPEDTDLPLHLLAARLHAWPAWMDGSLRDRLLGPLDRQLDGAPKLQLEIQGARDRIG